MTLIELQKLEREYLAAVCCVNDTGGLSLEEAADALARLSAKLLADQRRSIMLPAPARHVLHQPRQQVLPGVS